MLLQVCEKFIRLVECGKEDKHFQLINKKLVKITQSHYRKSIENKSPMEITCPYQNYRMIEAIEQDLLIDWVYKSNFNMIMLKNVF